MRSAALTLLAWAMVCTPVLAHGGGLEVFPQAVEMQFPQGYDVYSDAGKLLKTVPGPTSATVQAKTSGKTFAAGEVYLSDWSYEQLHQGKSPNWIVPQSSSGEFGTEEKEASDSLRGMSVNAARKRAHSPAAFKDVVLFPDPIEAKMSAFDVVDEQGTVLKTVEKESVMTLRGLIPREGKYLSQWSYDRLKLGAQPNFVVPSYGLTIYRNDSWDPFSGLDLSLPVLNPSKTDPDFDPWDQVCDYTRTATISDVVFAHHPATYSVFLEWSEGFSKNPWKHVFDIDGFSHTVANETSPDSLNIAIFNNYAGLSKREREWLDASLPGVYQALADIFRSDMSARDDQVKIPADLPAPQTEETVYLKFYRSPFVHKSVTRKGVSKEYVNKQWVNRKFEWRQDGYVRWFDLTDEERAALASQHAQLQPSFYGVAVYKGGKFAGNYPLFGAVDFEAFIEIMLRNYTKRNFGLTLGSTDTWLEKSFGGLYQKLFAPIQVHLANAKCVYWQAEGYFHLLPVDLIAISCGTKDGLADIPMVEVANVEAVGKASSFSTNLRGLGALLVANPQYKQGGQESPQNSVYDDSTIKLVSRAFSNRSLSFEDLPGADEEVGWLSGKLSSAGIKHVSVLRKEQASEFAVLEGLSQAGVAHIATHGFYLDMTLATDERGKRLFNELKNSTNPYFRSGLALAGANATLAEWSKGHVKGSAMDGVLLASEVKDLDLKNLSLLVLSACSTAEGKPVDGKSVASLREAFLQAGVETLVATLWDIPDDFAAKLMEDFYRRMLAGETPSIALWHAKKDNFLELRKTTGFAESMVKVAPFVAVTQAAKKD